VQKVSYNIKTKAVLIYENRQPHPDEPQNLVFLTNSGILKLHCDSVKNDMNNSLDLPASVHLLLELGRTFSSMYELDPMLAKMLKEIKNAIHCETASLWLVNDAETEIKCMYATGVQAEKIKGQSTRAKKFLAVYRTASGRLAGVEESYLSKWLDAKAYSENFNIEVRSQIGIPLIARDKLLGELNLVNKIGHGFTPEDYEFTTALAERIASSIQNTILYEQRNRTVEHQKLLTQISSHLHQTLNLDDLIPRIFMDVNRAINAEAQSIWLVNEKEGIIKCRFATGPSAGRVKGISVSLNAPSIVGSSVSKQESIIIKDARNDPRHATSVDETTGFITRSLMTVPMVLEDKSIGAIQAVNKRGGLLFTQDDLDLFRSIADSAALAVNNAQLVAELQNSYDLTLDALSAALDLRDRETEGHSRRVVEYTARIAQQMGLDKEAITTIRRGALIHDIGKIGVPDAILHKPGELNPDERNVMDRHPQVGFDMLSEIPYLEDEIQIVLCHQEKWDGTGYPRGLQGEEITLGARLFMIADTFDALLSDRPYRKGRPYVEARKVIEEEAGKQFDPKAVEAFLAVPPKDWDDIRARVTEEIERRRKRQMEATTMRMKRRG
jgi:HD-GYP domain-containing protein (c-di-GMP phosphodiesterase class II)